MSEPKKLIGIPKFSGRGEIFDFELFADMADLAYGNPRNLSPEELDRDKTRTVFLITHTTGEALKQIQLLGPDSRSSWGQLIREKKGWIPPPKPMSRTKKYLLYLALAILVIEVMDVVVFILTVFYAERQSAVLPTEHQRTHFGI